MIRKALELPSLTVDASAGFVTAAASWTTTATLPSGTLKETPLGQLGPVNESVKNDPTAGRAAPQINQGSWLKIFGRNQRE